MPIGQASSLPPDIHTDFSPSSSKSLSQKLPSVGAGLFPLLKKLLSDTHHKFNQVQLLGVTYGPGMFTGLRSGIVAVKSLAYAGQIPVVAVNTLEVIAFQALPFLAENGGRAATGSGSRIRVLPVINAQRQQLFTGAYEVQWPVDEGENHEPEIHEITQNQIQDRQAWLSGLLENDWVTGTGLKPILDQIPSGKVNRVDPSRWIPTATAVGKLAWKYFQAGRRDDIWKLEPFYFRPSYAEE